MSLTTKSLQERLARCDREIAEQLSKSGADKDRAYLTEMCHADWHTERKLIEKELKTNE